MPLCIRIAEISAYIRNIYAQFINLEAKVYEFFLLFKQRTGENFICNVVIIRQLIFIIC